MARTTKKASDDKLNLPQSTGAVEFDPSPDQWGVPDDNTSTDAFPFDAGATVMTQGYINTPTVVSYETPGPTTVMASFLTATEAKILDARHAAARSDVEVKDADPETEPADAEPQVEPESAPEVQAEPEAEPAQPAEEA